MPSQPPENKIVVMETNEVCMYVYYIYMYVCVYVYVCIYMYVYVCMYVCWCVCVRMCVLIITSIPSDI